jgi:putative DNA primase/helicase
MLVARGFERDWTHVQTNLTTRRYWRSGWWEWTGAHWTQTTSEEVRRLLYQRLEDAFYVVQTDAGRENRPWNPTRTRVNDVMDAILATSVLTPSATAMPCWVDGRDAGPLISCRNGLLDPRARTLMGHTPAYFNNWSLPFNYDQGAACPEWEKFLESLWPGDHQSKELLQEWFGYVLSGRTDLQKMLFILGPPRSGKGTISKVLTQLLGGSQNVAGPTLHSLSTNFGLSSLLGKPLAIMNDTRNARSTDMQIVTERLLSITGEDQLDIDRKNRELLSTRLPTRLMMLSNELPNFRDASSAIMERLLVLRMVTSFLGREDHDLEQRLTAELPGILNWALAGLDRIEARYGRFTSADAAAVVVEHLQDAGSRIKAFVRDECEVGAEYEVLTKDFFAAYAAWDKEQRMDADTRSTQIQIGASLMSAIPEVQRVRRTVDGNRTYVYTGITLRFNGAEALRQLGHELGQEG